jgi:hypothetical protein
MLQTSGIDQFSGAPVRKCAPMMTVEAFDPEARMDRIMRNLVRNLFLGALLAAACGVSAGTAHAQEAYNGGRFAGGCQTCGGFRFGGGHFFGGHFGGAKAGGPGHQYGMHGVPHHFNREYLGPQGPQVAQVAYPYYTTRGPRDYFANQPWSIGY